MTVSNGVDPHGQWRRAQMLKAKLASLDTDIANYHGDHAGLRDLKLHQQDIKFHLSMLPST